MTTDTSLRKPLSTETIKTINKYLENELTKATVLISILIDNYGNEVLDWEIQTILLELKDDFNVTLPDINRDKIEALRISMRTDQFFNDWLMFNNTCQALAGEKVVSDTFDPATPEQLAWGIVEIGLLYGKENIPMFSEDIRKFIGVILTDNGIIKPVDVLKLAIMPTDALLDNLDPDVVQAVYSRQDQEAEFILEYIKTNLKMLFDQLNNAPINHRDDDNWSKYFSKLPNI
jgi:hypothetical protein